jgi:hypothetical protein
MTAPISKTASWAPPPERTRKEILEDISESKRAAEALPQLQKRVEAAPKLSKELEEWERPFKQRRAEAISRARDIVAKCKEQETILQRHLKAEVEAPMWRAARAMIGIAELRSQLRDQVQAALKADFDAVLAANQEDPDNPQSFERVKGIAAETISENKAQQLMRELDPGWSPLRGLQQGPEADIASIIASLLWPRDYERPKPDSGAKG